MRVFRWVWRYVSKYKYLMFLGFFLASSVSLLNMINPFVQGRIVDDVILGGNTDLLFKLLAIIAGTTMLRAVIRYSFQMIFEYVSQNVLFNIRESIYSSLQKMDFAFFDRNKTGDLMSRMTGDLEAVRHFVAFVMYSTFFNILSFTVGMVVLFRLNFKLTLALLSISPFICYFTIKLSRSVKPAFAAIREQFSRLNSMVQENISGNRVVKAFAKEDYEIEKFLKENENFRQRNKDVARIWEKYLPVLDSMAGTLSVTVILLGGILVIRGDITLGELITFNGFIWTFNGPMRMAGWLINDMQRFAASAEKIMLVLNEQPRIKNPELPVIKPRLEGSVEFRNVSFRYRDEEILRDISFKVKPGQTVGIIGPTGSGKSTLVNLISRFYDCTEGEVLVDGINVKKYDIKSLRSGIAMAMQDIFLFSDTIEGNIAYGVPDAPMEKVIEAAKVAGAHDFIMEMTEGYDTIIGERGVGLSGGQRQRIALARALLKDPAILILDDTTSSVDIETERRIQESLKYASREKTTFIIAHRISSVKNADLILVLIDGRIVEMGNHDELIERQGYYYSVFNSQYGDFEKIRSLEVG